MTPKELEEALNEVYKDDPRRTMAAELAHLRAALAASQAREAGLQDALVKARDLLQRILEDKRETYCFKHSPYITLGENDVCPACEKEQQHATRL